MELACIQGTNLSLMGSSSSSKSPPKEHSAPLGLVFSWVRFWSSPADQLSMSEDASKSFVIQDEHMVAISKEFFFEGMPLPGSVFLRLGPNKYLMIGKAGEKAQFANLHAFNNDKNQIFVRKIDHPPIIQFLTSLTEKVMSQASVPEKIKTKFLLGLTTEAMRDFEGKEFASVAQLQNVSSLIISMGENIQGFEEVIAVLEQLPGEESKHSVATCMVALMLCEDMQLSLETAVQRVALGALLHDIGHKYLPKDLLSKPRHLWTLEETSIYEQHPIKGVEMLRDLKDISQDILLIVAEHHENAIGTGFPKKVRDVKVSPLSRIVIVANAFTNLIFSRIEGRSVFNAEQAIHYMETILGQPYNKQVFLALKNIVNKNFLKEKMRTQKIG